MNSYFIYYRIAPLHAESLNPVFRQIQAAVHATSGILGRLLRRDDDTGTWMEIYEGVVRPSEFENALDHAVAEANFDALLGAGEKRHVERFVDT